MSFNGYFLVVRATRPMTELPAVRRALQEYADGRPLAEVILGYRRDGDWQLLQCDADSPRVVDMVADSAAPALSIFTLESEVADVRAASPAAEPWFAILNPEGGRAYDAPDAGTIDEVTARAVAWAHEAGLQPNRADLAGAIGMRPGPFSEGIDEFLCALGLRFGDQEPITDF